MRWRVTICALCVALTARGAIFMYVDDDGRRHAVGSIDAVPLKYRDQVNTVAGKHDNSTEAERERDRLESARRRAEWLEGQSKRLHREQEEAVARQAEGERLRLEEERSAQGEVKVLIVKNRVYVPVTISHDLRQADAYLVLDTGAESTVIHADLAESIGIQYKNLDRSSAYGVGGVEVECRYFKLPSLALGPFRKESFYVGVVDYDGPHTTAKGLLGMDFLKHYEHNVDYARKVLQLTPRQTDNQ